MSKRVPKNEYIETVRAKAQAKDTAQAKLTTDAIHQDTGNKVARKATLVATQNIMLGGKTVIQAEAMIRGDLTRSLPSSSSSGGSKPSGSNTAVQIGRYCFLSKGCCLRPPGKMYKGWVLLTLFPVLPSFPGCRRSRSPLTPLVSCSVFSYMPLRMGDHVYVGPGAVVQAASVASYVHIGADVVVGEFAIIKEYVRILDGSVVPPHMVCPPFSVLAGRPARVIDEVPEGGHHAFELRALYKSVGNNPQPAGP